ncbi:MAG: uncharacterized protein JWM74_5622 [Myxococcaceae bacterium]|nr:uncharacterized protein [Myxococcaceae bacterium]
MIGWLTACAFAACGGDDTAVPTADAGSDAVATGDAAPPSDAPASDTSSKADTQTGPCTAADLCFDVVPVRPGTAPLPGKVIVVWAQLDDDGPDPLPKIAYEAPFAGTETSVVIPIAQIALPDEPNLLCKRACTDEAICPCLEDPRVGLGFVLVMPASSAGDASAFKTRTGIAQMAIAYSDKAFKPAPPRADGGAKYPYDLLFPDGIEQGVRGYVLVRADGSFDRLGASPPGASYPLQVCDTTDTTLCVPKGPNLT